MTEAAITWDKEKAVVRPAGDVVAATVPELRSALREVVGKGARRLVVDLANTRMVDSTGIGLLISAHNSMRKAGGALAVVRASTEILELFTTIADPQALQHIRGCERAPF